MNQDFMHNFELYQSHLSTTTPFVSSYGHKPPPRRVQLNSMQVHSGQITCTFFIHEYKIMNIFGRFNHGKREAIASI